MSEKSAYVRVSVTVPEDMREILIALLAAGEFEAFEEKDTGVEAWIQADLYQAEAVSDLLAQAPGGPYPYEATVIAPQNWNQVWEENYASVTVDTFCQVVPSFREPAPGFTWTLRIDPKMSFGTGHHETTRLMIRHLAALDPAGDRVLDMGTGTGILAILAARMGAASVTAIDIDPWCLENAAENLLLNDTPGISLLAGSVPPPEAAAFDLILANITRNVLLSHLPGYVWALAPGGKLIISGFYAEDEQILTAAAQQAGLTPARVLTEKNWMAIGFVKD